MLIYIIETMLLYVRRGADVLRLDAVTYLWAEPGTLFRPSRTDARNYQALARRDGCRGTLGELAHRDQCARMTKTSPILEAATTRRTWSTTLHCRHSFSTRSTVRMPRIFPNGHRISNTFPHNHLSQYARHARWRRAHGGKEVLPLEEMGFLIEKAKEHGAFISYKTEDGDDKPYEVNTTWYSALNMDDGGEDLAYQVKRYVASRSIALALRGVPAIYFHGLIGTRNDIEAVLRTKSKRDINRKVLHEEDLLDELKDPTANSFKSSSPSFERQRSVCGKRHSIPMETSGS